MPVAYNDIFPTLNGFMIKPLLVSPPMCTLKELQDGTYTIADLETMHQLIELKQHMAIASMPPPTQPQY
jgi:hypothetical protein